MDFVIQTGRGQMEAPNWSRDSKTLIFNRAGKVWSVPADEGEGRLGEARPIDIGNAIDCTGSHGLSPDGKWLAVTCTTPNQPGRRVYIVPAAGGTPRLVTANQILTSIAGRRTGRQFSLRDPATARQASTPSRQMADRRPR
jgi:Tol biopolymer transport system component